jgi:hypothetical protein
VPVRRRAPAPNPPRDGIRFELEREAEVLSGFDEYDDSPNKLASSFKSVDFPPIREKTLDDEPAAAGAESKRSSIG